MAKKADWSPSSDAGVLHATDFATVVVEIETAVVVAMDVTVVVEMSGDTAEISVIDGKLMFADGGMDMGISIGLCMA